MSHASELIAKDINQYLRQHENKDLLRFITCGSVDDGKSTLIGRLLHDSHLIYEDQLAAITTDSKKSGTTGDEVDLALLVDGLQSEREQGITIDVAYRFFSTEKRKFIIADTPGHEQYTRNMATGASTASLAVLLVDARLGIQVQTKRHSFICSLLGIRHFIVAVNKMDAVNYDESIYNEIRIEYLKFAENLKLTDVRFVPISALKGDNVVNHSINMDWYHGHTLMHLLEIVEVSGDKNLDDFRFPIQYVLRPDSTFRGYAGSIASGVIRPGDSVTVLPSRKKSRVKKIITMGKDIKIEKLDEAFPLQSVTITLTDEIDISRGDLLVRTSNEPPMLQSIEAKVVWMHEDRLEIGKQYIFKFRAKIVTGYVSKVYYRVDINTMEKIQTENLGLNDIAYCKIELSEAVPTENYQKNRGMGAFIFIDRINNLTVGAGMIDLKTSPEERNVVWHKSVINKSMRANQKNQKPTIVWFTGLSGAGKSTLANALENDLFRKGFHTYLLDGDNIRHGLNKDLGFREEEREENIRRIGEVAKLMVDAGMIVITAFISPYRKDRQIVRDLVEDGEFIEIFVDTPIEVCEKRDVKGLYEKARAGEIKNFTGIDSPYEEPKNPEIHIKTEETSIERSVEMISDFIANA